VFIFARSHFVDVRLTRRRHFPLFLPMTLPKGRFCCNLNAPGPPVQLIRARRPRWVEELFRLR
jgi:hypothetical protein